MSDLQFQSFTSADFSTNATNEQGFSGKIGDKNQLVDGETTTSGPKRNFFSFAFYQQFFDVDTDQVTKRLLNSVVPTHNNFIADFVQPIPDLYGPFWICVTLVFSIGIFSNIAQYIENEGGSGDYGSDFRMVTGASSLISTYVLLLPFLLYTLIWYRKTEIQYSYFELLCAYGYSLAVFIPVSILWTFDINWFRWTLIFAAVGLSGTVLAKSLWAAFKNDSNKLVKANPTGALFYAPIFAYLCVQIAFGAVGGVVFCHFVLAICFKEYFFDAVHAPKTSVPALNPLPDNSMGAGAGSLPTAAALKSEPEMPSVSNQKGPMIPQQEKETKPASGVQVAGNVSASEELLNSTTFANETLLSNVTVTTVPPVITEEKKTTALLAINETVSTEGTPRKIASNKTEDKKVGNNTGPGTNADSEKKDKEGKSKKK